MSKGALKEIFLLTPDDFKIMVKNIPNSEKNDLLKNLQKKLTLLENLI